MMRLRCLLFLTYCLLGIPAFLSGSMHWKTPDLLFKDSAGRHHPVIGSNQHGDIIIGWFNAADKRLEIGEYDFILDGISTLICSYPCDMESQLLTLTLSENKDIFALWREKTSKCIKAAKYESQTNTWVDTLILDKLESLDTPLLKTDSKGNGIVIWTRFNGLEYQVHASHFSNINRRWSDPLTVSPIGFDCHLQKIAFDSQGNAIAIWKSLGFSDPVHRGKTKGIQAKRFDGKSECWEQPLFFSDFLDHITLTHPDIIFDPSDHLIMIWERLGPPPATHMFQFISYDTKLNQWGNKSDIVSDHPNCMPLLVGNKNNIYVFWKARTGLKNEQLQCLSLNYPAGPQSTKSTFSFPLSSISEFEVSSDPLGKLYAAYTGENQIRVSCFDRSWIESVVFYGQDKTHDMHLAHDAIGNSLLVWEKENHIFYSRGDYLLPPTCLNAKIHTKRFAAKSVKRAELTWVSSNSPSLVGYKILRNGELIAIVPAYQTSFIDLRFPRGQSIYAIKAVNNENLESQALEILVLH